MLLKFKNKHKQTNFFEKVLFCFSYTYADPLSISICESQSATISCNSGKKIDVLEAMYGRQNSYTCGNDDLSCSSGSSYSVVYHKCQDRFNCLLQAINNVFGDPCVGYGKYLFVKYQCIE